VLLASLFSSKHVQAEPSCAGSGDAVVLVAFTGTRWPAELRSGVLTHLRAGLEPTGFRVCDAEGAGDIKKVATVELRQNPGERVTATIEVRDGITAKRVARDIDLSALPDDARPLGVGVAADELLRASWVELSLTGAPKPATPPPPAVRRAVESSLRRPEPPRRSEASGLGAAEGYTGGLVLFGGDIAFEQRLGSNLGIGLALGLRQSAQNPSAHGSISASTFAAGAALLVDLAHAGPLRFALELGARASDVRLRGQPAAGSTGTESSAVGVDARAGVGLAYRIGSQFLVSLKGGAGVPLRAVVGRDHGQTEVGLSGFEWYAALGPAVAF
jgi:hypothetical protein